MIELQGVRDYEVEVRANMDAMEAERLRERQQHHMQAEANRDSIADLQSQLNEARAARWQESKCPSKILNPVP